MVMTERVLKQEKVMTDFDFIMPTTTATGPSSSTSIFVEEYGLRGTPLLVLCITFRKGIPSSVWSWGFMREITLTKY
jgi:hypothetical protein